MKKNKFLTYFGILTLFVEMFKMFYGFGPFFQGWFFALLWMALYAVLYPTELLQKRVLPFYFFFIIAVLYHFMGSTGERFNELSDLIYFLNYFLFPFLYFYYNKKHVGVKTIRVIVGILSVITVYYAVRTRQITGGNLYFIRQTIAVDMENINNYRFLGLADYSLTHAILFIVPALVFFVKGKFGWIVKTFALVLLATAFILVYYGGATTPLILFVASLIMSLMVNPRRNMRDNIILALLIIIPVLILLNDNILLNILEGVDGFVGSTSPVHRKIDDFRDSILINQASGTVEGRLSLYGNSWATFFTHPLFGTLNGNLIGGHAYFVDILAATGLLGSSFLFWYLFKVIKYTYSVMPKPTKVYYLIGVFMFVVLGFMKNLSGNDFFVIPFVYLPFLCLATAPKESDTVEPC